MNRRDLLLRTAFAAGAAFAARIYAATPAGSMATGGQGVSLAVGGDTTLGFNLQDHFDSELAAGRSREELLAYYFAGIQQVFGAADLRVVNLECPFTERGKKLPKNFNFRARLEMVDILKAGRVDVASLANNHLNDWGANGITDTRHTLDAAGIGHFGAGANLAASRLPLLIERNGLKLGFLGYYFQAGDDMLEPHQIYATQKTAGVAGVYKTLAPMKTMLRNDMTALAKKVDLPVVYFHWGKEGTYEVQDYQRELAYLAIDCGCRAVFGAHPHRLQGVEVYRNAPIFYSLGNFVYGGIKNPKDALTMIARVRLAREGFEADVVPLEFTAWPDRQFQPVVLEGPVRDAAMARISELSAGFPTLPTLSVSGAALTQPVAG